MSRWIHVRGGHLLDPGSGLDAPGDVWVRDGVVQAVVVPADTEAARTEAARATPPAPGADVEVLDAAGCLVTPMFVDLHVHLREPGGESAETVASGCAAALRGGYGAIHAMPNTAPVCDDPEVVERVRAAARGTGVDVVPVSALSRGLRGEALVDLEAMAAAGAGAFSDDGAWLADERLAREAFAWAARNRRVVMQHCEDLSRAGPGVVHDCARTRGAGLPGIPREAEDRAVERDLRLAEATGAHLHVCHVSTQGAVAALRRAREAGLPVSGEVTPHHLVLTVADALAGGANFKMKPPLREASDVDALVDALADGTLDAVATDHAPHTAASKAAGLAGAPFGAIGLETAFAVLYTDLVARGRLGLGRLVAALTVGPSRVVAREPFRIEPGAAARLVVLDLGTTRPVDRTALASRSDNCPFEGRRLRGWPVASVAGDRVHRHPAGSGVRNRTRRAPPP